MPQFKVDYIIVGQGIAGTWLAIEMLKRGLSFLIIDEDKDETSSKRAAGIYNPITGRKMIKTWRADELFPNLEKAYQELEKEVKAKFLHPVPIYRPFRTIEDQNDWDGKIADQGYEKYVHTLSTGPIGYPKVADPIGGIVLNHSGYVDIPTMLEASRSYFMNKGVYKFEVFDTDKLKMEEEMIRYENYTANKVVFCEGSLSKNPFWDLPFRPVRGEIMDIQADLKAEHIINQGVFMIPKGTHFTVGSTYDHKNLTYEPQEEGIKSLEDRLQKLYTGAYRIVNKRAGVRPATHDRKPYIGLHPDHKTLAIFNGFGTKGVSLSPYFARHFVDVLQNKTEIDQEVNVQRVY